MFAKRNAIVVVEFSLLVGGFGGCGFMLTKEMVAELYRLPYSERPLGPQPNAEKMKPRFGGIPIKTLPVFIRGQGWNWYHPQVIEDSKKGGKRQSGKIHFTTDPERFIKIPGPPSDASADTFRTYIMELKEELRGNGFNVTDAPCKYCLEIGGDFGYYFHKSREGWGAPDQEVHLLVRPVLYWEGAVILATRDDLIPNMSRKRIMPEDVKKVANFAAYLSRGEIVHTWCEVYEKGPCDTK